MLTNLQLRQAIQRGGERARQRIRSGELDPFTGDVGRVMVQALLMAEIRDAVTGAICEGAGYPPGSTLTPIRSFEGWALAVNRPQKMSNRNNGKEIR